MHKSTRFALGILVATTAFGHDLYLMPERFIVTNGEPLAIAVHNGDSFPQSEASASIERLRDGMMVGVNGNKTIDGLRVDDKRTVGTVVVPSQGELVLSIRTIPNFIELEPDKFLPYLKEEGLKDVIAWREVNRATKIPGRERYSKYAKALLLAGNPSDYYKHVVGFPIEIVPEKDPYTLKKGDSLPVQVLYRGAPAADLQLEADYAGPQGSKTRVVGRTDKDGRISVPLNSTGKWRLHSLKMEHLTPETGGEPAADWESFWASLTFEIR